MPHVDRLLPIPVWETFATQFRRASGLSLVMCDSSASPVRGEAAEVALCPVAGLEGRSRCATFYQKAARQVIQGEEPVLFRCPFGFLVFGLPLRLEEEGGSALTVVFGGPALPSAASDGDVQALAKALNVGRDSLEPVLQPMPVLSPRKVLEIGRLAGISLKAVLQGNLAKESFSLRHSQVLTLSEVGSDLAGTASTHELFALALNALGVLFDVGCAGALLADESGGTFRTHSAMGEFEKALQAWALPAGAPWLRECRHPGGISRLDAPQEVARLGLPEGAERITFVALGDGGRVPGLLAIVNRVLSVEEEQLVRGLALQVGVALENRRLQEEIARQGREIEVLRQVSRQFVSCLEPDTLFEAILLEASKLTGARRGSFMVSAKGNGELLVRAVTGMDDSLVRKLRLRSGQGIAGQVFASGEPIVVGNVEQDPRFHRKNRPRYATKSFLSLPVTVEGRAVGVLNLSDKLSGEVFSAADLRIVEAVAVQASLAIERSTYFAQSRELRKISITDPLTGLLNRRYLQERLTEEVDRASRHDHPLSLIMADIDHFKAYNDANGHPAGDKALVLVGRALRNAIRTIDVVSRFGGEEFAVILPETRKAEALEIGERIRGEIEALYFPGEEALSAGRLTISLGLAGFPEDAREIKSLIQRADRALYQAKAQGRNRIVAYAPPEEPPPDENPPEPDRSWTKVL